MRILGIDPGTLNLGWGFIQSNSRGAVESVQFGCLSTPNKMDFFQRLHYLQSELQKVIKELKPQVAVIEQIFLGKNVDSAFKLGHIRGVCAVECQMRGAQIVEYSPRTVKKQITGSGQADKMVVQNFVGQHLQLTQGFRKLDESDALALALCHLLQQDSVNKLRGMRP